MRKSSVRALTGTTVVLLVALVRPGHAFNNLGAFWKAKDSAPNAFSFNPVTGANTNTVITSAAVTLSGFNGPLTATCSGCTAIARNGTWGGTSVSGFQPNDTITIRLTSSSSLSTAVSATATVGSTSSAPWLVTTASTCTASTTTDTNENTYSYMNGGRTMVNRNIALSAGTISTLGFYNIQATTFAATLMIVRENSASNFTVVASVSTTIGPGGWTTATLATPYTVPGSGTYRLAAALPDAGTNYSTANGYAALASGAYTSGTFDTNGYAYAPGDCSGSRMRAGYCP